MHFGQVYSTKFTQPPLLRTLLGLLPPPPRCVRTLWMLPNPISFQDENLKEVHQMIEMEDAGVDQKLKSLFEQLQQGETATPSSLTL